MADKRPKIHPQALEIVEALRLDPGLIASRNLPMFEEASDLVVADVSRSGREHRLLRHVAGAWRRMKADAEAEGVSLVIISAYRSIERQGELIRRQLDQGCNPELLFVSSAPPGYSEHHTGRAIDIGTPGCTPLSEEFADTSAYTWLTDNAKVFGFSLSYPEGNRFGYCYEPWHWFHDGAA